MLATTRFQQPGFDADGGGEGRALYLVASACFRDLSEAIRVSLIRFLLQRNAITGELALDALDSYRRSRIPIGRLAMRENLLGLGSCIHVLDLQLEDLPSASRRLFGEIAVGLGYLSQAQVGFLLDRQRAEGPTLPSILLELGGGEAEHLQDELEAYGRSRGPTRRI